MKFNLHFTIFTFDCAQDSVLNKSKDFSDTKLEMSHRRQRSANKRCNDLLVDMVDMQRLHKLSKLRILRVFAESNKCISLNKMKL